MFRKWCYEKKFTNKHNLSHVLMDGGNLSIPFDKLEDFYKECIRAYKSDEKIFVVEQKTPTYNFFVDIDYKDDTELSIEQVVSITQIICDKVRTFGGNKCLISVAEPKPKDGMTKTGIHMNWPGFVVNQEGAIQLRHHIISTLGKIYFARNWEQDVDNSVYGTAGKKGSGFRLPWSHKMADGKIEGEYLPIYLYEDGKMDEVSQEPTLEMFMNATVRTQVTEVVEIPELVVLCQIINPKKKEGDFKKSEMKNEIHNSELLGLLEPFIRKNMDGQSQIKIQNIFKLGSVFLLKSNSKYCENLKREHHSNHIKLQVEDTPKGWQVHQKCFCTCEVLKDRKSGKFCKNFEGRRHQLSSSICKILDSIKK